MLEVIYNQLLKVVPAQTGKRIISAPPAKPNVTSGIDVGFDDPAFTNDLMADASTNTNQQILDNILNESLMKNQVQPFIDNQQKKK